MLTCSARRYFPTSIKKLLVNDRKSDDLAGLISYGRRDVSLTLLLHAPPSDHRDPVTVPTLFDQQHDIQLFMK